MEPFRIIKSKATPLDMVNVDTDQIVPKQFLKLVQKSGYGRYLFYDWRFDKDGRPKSNFVLNDPKYVGRQILLTRDNFGSGSSREHAAWAILDYGFKAVIAPSFADIFYNNCLKNGILPVRLSHEEVDFMFINADDVDMEIDLSNQQITMGSKSMNFEIDESRKNTLLEGLDEIGITLQFDPQITEYERRNCKFIAPYY
jgi:3-isopropylmalate/(R)-2-methylmalate dehydratase small subunit